MLTEHAVPGQQQNEGTEAEPVVPASLHLPAKKGLIGKQQMAFRLLQKCVKLSVTPLRNRAHMYLLERAGNAGLDRD